MTDRQNRQTASDDAIRAIKGYLHAMEERDMARAASFLADEFQMLFPGDQTFRTLNDLITWAKPRYRWVKKSYDQFDTCAAEEETIVYCYGTLHGQ